MPSETMVRPWLVLPEWAGVVVQLAGLTGAAALLRRASRVGTSGRIRLLVTGWLLAYFNSHALAHWAVGRLGGIRFTGFGMHGTTVAAWYPPGLRSVMRHLPFWSARTEPASRRAASPVARAAMYVAGPLATIAVSLGIPAYARTRGVPGALVLLRAAGIWIAGMLFGELAPRSDLRRAFRELRQAMGGRPHTHP